MEIAILMATYMGEKFVGEQIESILKQTYQDWVLYIHDDGSKDKTLEIIDTYVKQYPEKIKIVEGESTGGARNNFLYLMTKVDASYYMCCDQDDVWLPMKIEKTVSAMKEIEQQNDEPVPCLVFTDLTVVDGNLNVIAERMSQYQNLDCKNTEISRVLMQNVVTGCTMMMNKPLRDATIRYNCVDKIIMHDWWAALVAAQFGKMKFVEEPTILYRQHGSNSVGAVDTKSVKYVIEKMNQAEEIKQSLKSTRVQAGEFAEVFDLKEQSLAMRYSKSDKMNKVQRISFYRKNNLTKSGFFRKVGLFVWG